MAEIIEKKRRHYTGLDADKDTIPAEGKVVGDSYHANDKGKQYYWNGTAWKTGLGYEYVVRDVAAWDKQVGDFTTNGNWHVDGLDLSGVVPAGAVAVNFRIELKDDAANSEFRIRRNATQLSNATNIITQAANVSSYRNLIVAIDSNRLFDYYGDNLVFVTINLVVVGWFI